jgi:hypothetical protein
MTAEKWEAHLFAADRNLLGRRGAGARFARRWTRARPLPRNRHFRANLCVIRSSIDRLSSFFAGNADYGKRDQEHHETEKFH